MHKSLPTIIGSGVDSLRIINSCVIIFDINSIKVLMKFIWWYVR